MPPRPSPAPRPDRAQRPRPTPRRPRPYAALESTAAATTTTERPTGIAAFLRRHPHVVRRGGLGAIAAGTVVFVVASLVTPGASARFRDAARPAVAPQPRHTPLTESLGMPSALDVTAYQERALRTKKRAHPNAVTTAAISSLASNGIPTVALNAYRVAAARMGNVEPSCGIDWAMLAGIGRIESDHGRFGGAVLHTDGTSTPRIIGAALNGHGTALIPAPADGAALAGDSVYTHALGPMQFIPQTWAGYGADANNDGSADIFNINDAALGAARYLCAAGGELRSHEGRVRAVLAYNHVDAYVQAVLALADAYRRGIPISGVPIGDLSGKLPPVKKGKVPAANPGRPTALDGKKHRGKPGATGSPAGTGGPRSRSGSATSSGASGSSSSRSSSSPSRSSGSSSTPPPSSSPPSGGGSSSSSSPRPSPTKTCAIGLGTTCVLP